MSGTLVITETGRYQYASNGLLTNDLFATTAGDVPRWNLLHVDGFNASANVNYLQIWPGVPGGGGIYPVKVLRVGPSATFSWAPPSAGFSIVGTTGFSWAFSTTPVAYTASADTAWVQAILNASIGQ